MEDRFNSFNHSTKVINNKSKFDLLGLTKHELKSIFAEISLPDFRTKQVWRWIYREGHKNFTKMTNLSKELRIDLDQRFFISRPEVVSQSISLDGTTKWLLRLNDNNEVECVWIPEPGRGTLCISSQVGCTLNCSFCHTGTQKLVRNLSVSEILGQVMFAMDYIGDWPTARQDRILSNIVLMGMGEPLLNYENVKTALEIIMDHSGISLSRRRITLSTAGIIPGIEKCGKDLKVNLAISLHATNDNLRNELVPINKKYNIKSLIECVKNYSAISNSRRVTWEYVMIKDINDKPVDAKNLVKIIRGIPSKINLIPFNEWPGSPFECSEGEVIKNFAKIIMNSGYASPIRTPRGRDVMAACGQLKSNSMRNRKLKL